MTLWAKKSDFEAAFDEIGNVDWSVYIREKENVVVFIIEPESNCSIDITRFNSSHAFEQMNACGSKSVKLELSNTPKFKVAVEHSKLPSDYKE